MSIVVRRLESALILGTAPANGGIVTILDVDLQTDWIVCKSVVMIEIIVVGSFVSLRDDRYSFVHCGSKVFATIHIHSWTGMA